MDSVEIVWKGPKVELLLFGIHRSQMMQFGHLDSRPPRCTSGAIFQGCSALRRLQGRPGKHRSEYISQPAWVCLRKNWMKKERTWSICLHENRCGILPVNEQQNNSHTCASQCTLSKDAFSVLEIRLKLESFSASFCESCPTTTTE